MEPTIFIIVDLRYGVEAQHREGFISARQFGLPLYVYYRYDVRQKQENSISNTAAIELKTKQILDKINHVQKQLQMLGDEYEINYCECPQTMINQPLLDQFSGAMIFYMQEGEVKWMKLHQFLASPLRTSLLKQVRTPSTKYGNLGSNEEYSFSNYIERIYSREKTFTKKHHK